MKYLIKIRALIDQRSLFQWCGFFVVLNLMLRLLFITVPDVQLDEPFSIYYASVGWDALWEMIPNENSPPLHFIFLKCWASLVGVSVFALRLPSVVFTSFTVVFVILIGEKYLKRYTGIIAAVFYTFSNLVMYHSHEIRVYGWFIFISAASFYLFFKYLETEKTKWVLWLAVINTLVLYSHFVGWFVLGIQGLSVLLTYRTSLITMIKKGLLLCIPVLLYLPYLAIFLSRVTKLSKGTWIDPPVLHDLYRMFYKSLNEPIMVIVILTLFTGYAAYSLFGKYRSGVLFKYRVTVILWWGVPLVGLWAYSFFMPFYLTRYVVFGVPGLCLYFAFILSAYQDWLPKAAPYLITVVLLFSAATTDLVADGGASIRAEWEMIARMKDQNTSVVITPGWYDKDFAFFYEGGKYFRQGVKMESELAKVGVYSFHDADEKALGDCCLKDQVVVFHFMDDDIVYNQRLLAYMRKNYKEEKIISGRISLFKK